MRIRTAGLSDIGLISNKVKVCLVWVGKVHS